MLYYKWFCSTLISTDWRTWNTVLDAERGLFISWPLTIFLAVHLVLLGIAWSVLTNWLYVRKARTWWFSEGFAEGAHSKAVRLAEIKFSKTPSASLGCILWQWSDDLCNDASRRFDQLVERTAEAVGKK